MRQGAPALYPVNGNRDGAKAGLEVWTAHRRGMHRVGQRALKVVPIFPEGARERTPLHSSYAAGTAVHNDAREPEGSVPMRPVLGDGPEALRSNRTIPQDCLCRICAVAPFD